MRIVTSLLVVLGLAAASMSSAAPKGSVLRWKLDIKPDTSTLRNPAGRMTVKPRRGRTQVYWYLVYNVKNVHDEAIPLSTHFRVTTDASDEVFHEGYYPLALAKIRQRWGEDVIDSVNLKGYELAPGESVTAVAIFQLFKPGTTAPRPFEERSDKLTIHVSGYADPVKKVGLGFETENIEYLMHFEKLGDEFDAYRESVRFLRAEEKVVASD